MEPGTYGRDDLIERARRIDLFVVPQWSPALTAGMTRLATVGATGGGVAAMEPGTYGALRI